MLVVLFVGFESSNFFNNNRELDCILNSADKYFAQQSGYIAVLLTSNIATVTNLQITWTVPSPSNAVVKVSLYYDAEFQQITVQPPQIVPLLQRL
jgi:hypothetical protein